MKSQDQLSWSHFKLSQLLLEPAGVDGLPEVGVLLLPPPPPPPPPQAAVIAMTSANPTTRNNLFTDASFLTTWVGRMLLRDHASCIEWIGQSHRASHAPAGQRGVRQLELRTASHRRRLARLYISMRWYLTAQFNEEEQLPRLPVMLA